MRKILSILIAFLVLVVGAQSIMAVDNAYKNSLLKIQVNEIDSNNYDIGLYTQKIYNEPVQIIKKSETIYYFLLPETNHAITSVSPVGAIKNVLVKTYPYAGQDMNNGYTKVAIITAKPVNLSTSLRTLDTSVSPRLDPLRLARLDSVFERYSERLAQNNIPTPLAEFRKTASAQTPAIKSNVDIKTEPVKVASAAPKKTQSAASSTQTSKPQTATSTQPKKTQTTVAKSFEDYQNQKNKAQAEQTAAATKKQAVQKTTAVSKPAVTSKPVVASKPAATSKPAEAKVAANVKPAVSPAKQAVSTKPAAETKQSVSSSKPQETPKVATANKQDIQKPAQKEAQAVSKPKSQEVAKPEKAAEENIKIAAEPKQTQSPNAEKQSSSEPIVVDNTVNMSFRQDETSANEENKQIEAKVADDKQDESASTSNDENTNTNTNKNNDIWCWLAMLVGIASLYYLVGDVRKKKAAKSAQNTVNETKAPNIKEVFKKQETMQDIQEVQEAQPIANEPELLSTAVPQEIEPVVNQLEVEPPITEEEQEKIDAFNTYMESVSEDEQEQTIITPSTPDDEVIEQLYTPIESPVYKEEEAPMVYENYESSEPVEDDDVATIVSSSKLTETRGLYLAKFDGATSLVGYIQDDIYVLYNFGDIEVSDTEIESTLAQENDTDSLYLVKTGGKKLMVKSTPYDMSLEMVM